MIKLYDNQTTQDRYSMVVHGVHYLSIYEFSANALESHGVNRHLGEFKSEDMEFVEAHSVVWESLPLSVQIACLQRLDPRE